MLANVSPIEKNAFKINDTREKKKIILYDRVSLPK